MDHTTTSQFSNRDVVIPSHLLRAASNARSSWQPEKNDRRFDAPRLILEQVPYLRAQETQVRLHHAATVTIGGLGRSRALGLDSQANDFRVTGGLRAPLRKTSLPTSLESRNQTLRQSYLPGTPDVTCLRHGDPSIAQQSSTLSTARESNEISRKPSYESNVPDSISIRRSDEPWAQDTIYHGLNNFSFSSAGSSTASHTYEDLDPMIVEQGPRRQPTLRKVDTSTNGVQRSGTISRVTDAVQRKFSQVGNAARRGSMYEVYEKAKKRGVHLQRQKWVQVLFEYVVYLILLAFIYFVLIGMPLWKGAVYWLWWVVGHKFVIAGGFSITVGLAAIYAFAPLLILFEKDPPMPEAKPDAERYSSVQDTALLIPCYKSAGLIAATLEAALQVFPASSIFVIANGNSPTPLDNTEEVCRPYGVNHVWSPIGAKIVAQFVGCYAAKGYKNVLLIDDDCALPPNFPVVSERLSGKVQCIGYTIKSVGPNSSNGNLCQQAQDLEYKLSGLQRALAGKIGSATFPHGAISLWDREVLIKTFHEHPGFSVSEDWFFGHVARELGCRIQMCTSVFVETETPSAVFFSSGGSRGGFGEMTIYKQRFLRWNFFFVNGMWYNMAYIFGSWKLGWWELGAKLFVFQEVYETLLYLLTPFILPISFIVRPAFCGYLVAGTFVMYLANVIIFNEIHLRRKKERLGWQVLYVYYMPYKMVLTCINVASCYWSLFKYARYFAKRHPKVIEDEKAVEVVIKLEETPQSALSRPTGGGRRMTATAIGTRVSVLAEGAALQAISEKVSQNQELEAPGPTILPSNELQAGAGNTGGGRHIGTVDFASPLPKEIELQDRGRRKSAGDIV